MARKLGRPFGFHPFGFGAVSALPTVWSTFGPALAANWDLQSTPIHKDFVGTATTTPGDNVALVFDNALWGGRSLASVIAAQTELRGNGTTGLVGSATAASYNTSTGAGSVSRVDLGNQSYVGWTGLNSNSFYAITITNTGATNQILIRPGSAGGAVSATINPGATQTVYFRPDASTAGTVYIAVNGAGSSTFTITSLKLVPGTHFYQSSAGSQPKLASYPRCGVRNLLLNTPFAGAVAGTPGTAPTNWPFNVSGGTLAVSESDSKLSIVIS